jgi:hypothetical protein
MINENDKFKYAECIFCGQEKKCFVRVDSDEELAVCPDCFCVADDID